MQQTPRRKIQYPTSNRLDRPDVPLHLSILALALDSDVIYNSGLDSDRRASAHQVGGGRIWWSTDTQTMWYDDGSTWQSLGNAPLDSPVFTGEPQAPTPISGDVSTAIATTAFVASFFPPGIVVPYAGGTEPLGWLMCDGRAVSRVTYVALFAIVSTTYGVGDGINTFNLPDLRGRVPVGLNAGTFNALGETGGEETHVTTTTEMPSHTHTESAVSAGTPAGTIANNTAGLVTGNDTVNHVHGYTKPVMSTIIFNVGSADSMTLCTSTISDLTGAQNTTHSHTIAAHNHVFTGTPLGTHSHVIANTGGGAAHNNLQPYITLNYIIKF